MKGERTKIGPSSGEGHHYTKLGKIDRITHKHMIMRMITDKMTDRSVDRTTAWAAALTPMTGQ